MKYMEKFNVIIEDINRKEFIPYDVIPYLVSCYNKAEEKPSTFDEFKKFIERKAMYQWWSRCQYEIIISSWPSTRGTEEKWDVYKQVMMNIDVVTDLVMKSVKHIYQVTGCLQLGSACPSDWELIIDNREGYARYRHGCLTIEFTDTEELIFKWYSNDLMDGIMTTDELIEITKNEFNWNLNGMGNNA